MEGNQLILSMYVILKDGCPLSFSVLGSGQVEITCGDARDGCQLMLDADSLRRLVTRGGAAMAEMDALFAREEAEECRELTEATAS